jgi:phosphoglycerate dehydrogenase-like enzyme
MHLSNVVAAVAASLLLAPSISPAEYTIDNLIEETGVREGPAALRRALLSVRGFVGRGRDADEMTSLARDADVIVNALPLTDTTRGLLDAEFFEAGGNAGPRYFINVGRGATVDTQALLAALQSGQLAGAGLDVTDPEPLPRDHPLWREQNVIITPHVSSRGSDRFRYQLLTLENMRRYLAGDRLLNVVDPEKGY